MRLLLYTFLCSAVVSFGRSQATWDRGVAEATAQINVLASVFMSQPGHLQQKHTVFSAMNWTDIPPPQPTGNVSQQCQKDVAQYEADLFQGKRYALKMLDASGKPASGLMDWNWEWFGRYTECVKITREVFSIPFDGKFYMTRLEQVRQGEGILADVYELTVGMCVPSSCGQHDVIHQLDGSVYWRFVVQQGIFKVTSAYSEESLPIQNVTIAAICICSVLLLLIAIGTIYDVVIQHLRRVAIKRQKDTEEQEADVAVSVPGDIALVSLSNSREETPTAATTGEGKEGIIGRVLLCFSVYTNVRKLLSTKQAPGSITCLHGIRFLSMTWVILGHTYLVHREGLDNRNRLGDEYPRFTFQAVNNATVSVDSFFFLSGLLMSYLLLKQIQKSKENGKSVSYGMVYFHRYWRLTPTYMFVLMLYMWVLPYTLSGPYWPSTPDRLDPYCRDSWWMNLLYINNFVKGSEMCMDQTWYLANDMQFFVIGVPLVYLISRWQKVGLVVNLVLLLASFITIAVLGWHNNMWAPTGTLEYYWKPYCRIGPYLVGIFVGWLLIKMKRKQTRSMTFSLLMTIGWLVAAASAVTVLYSTYGIYDYTTLQTKGENVSYLVLHRTVWAMALGWVVVACYHGYGGVVNSILSWEAWVPLSRLTYGAYLMQSLVMKAVHLSREVPIHYTTITMIYFFLGHVAISFGLAFLVSVAVEAPLMGLEKIIFKK